MQPRGSHPQAGVGSVVLSEPPFPPPCLASRRRSSSRRNRKISSLGFLGIFAVDGSLQDGKELASRLFCFSTVE